MRGKRKSDISRPDPIYFNLYDTYQYYQQEAESALPKVKIVSRLRDIPREKKAFQVEKRDIEVYHILVNASSEVGP